MSAWQLHATSVALHGYFKTKKPFGCQSDIDRYLLLFWLCWQNASILWSAWRWKGRPLYSKCINSPPRITDIYLCIVLCSCQWKQQWKSFCRATRLMKLKNRKRSWYHCTKSFDSIGTQFVGCHTLIKLCFKFFPLHALEANWGHKIYETTLLRLSCFLLPRRPFAVRTPHECY